MKNSAALGCPSRDRRGRRGTNLAVFTSLALLGLGLSACQQPTTPPPGGDLLSVEQLIPAATGGTVDIPNGAMLEIPPGALDADTLIRVTIPKDPSAQYIGDVYVLEPNGLTFNTPATLTIPTPEGTADVIADLGEPHLVVFVVSDLHTPFDAGSELALYEEARVVDRDDVDGTISIELDHFTAVYAYNQIDELAYLVTDIPPKYLQPADLFFTLTQIGFLGSFEQEGPNWAPGHVGVFSPRAGMGVDRRFGRIVEATPPKVQNTTLADFKADKGHLSLGPRRVAGGLTQTQQQDAVTFVEAQRGKDYAAVLGQGNLTAGAYSCVGLAESTLDAVGAGVLNIAQEATISAPLELFRRTVPVRELTLYVGEHVDFQVYGVVVDPDSYGVGLVGSPWDYYCACEYDIAAANLPTGATFTGTQPLDHGPAASYTYRFAWTPGSQHANQTFTVTLQMGYNVHYLFKDEYKLITDDLVIHVLPLSGQTVTSVSLQHDLVLDDTVWFPAGSVVPLENIEGGKVVEGHPGCGDGDPHLHAEGEGIVADGIGPFPDPNPGGCGYGTIVEVPIEHVD